MPEILLITDNRRRAERLAKDLGGPGICVIYDLYDAAGRFDRPARIVSDIRDKNSDALLRLRRLIDGMHGHDLPHILLVHGDAARAEVQGRLLGAETMPASAAAQMLPAWLRSSVAPPAPASPQAAQHAQEAGRFLERTFFSGEAVTPTRADTSTGLITRAIHEAGIRDWVGAVQRFDDVTHQHILLVAGLAVAFATSLGLNPRDRHEFARAALLHDVGKTKIPTAILNKPGKLDPEELRVMRTHAAVGHAMLADTGFDPIALRVVRSHHEMLDGSGYPDGMRADAIPDLVRLVTICDVYAALIERRPYKAPLSGTAALAILDDMGGRLDGDLVRAFRPVAMAFDGAAGSGA